MNRSYDISYLNSVAAHAHAANDFKDSEWYCATVIDKDEKTTCMEVHEMITTPRSRRQPFPLKTVYEVCEPMKKKQELIDVARWINR